MSAVYHTIQQLPLFPSSDDRPIQPSKQKTSLRPDRETVQHLYETERLTTRQIGSQFSVSKTEVMRWLKFYGIPLRAAGGRGKGLAYREIEPPTREMLEQWVHVEHQSYEQIAQRYDVSKQAVAKWLKEHHIQSPTIWETRRKGVEIILPTEDELRQMYLEEGLSLDHIGAQHGVCANPIARLCKEFGISIRPDGFNGGMRLTCNDGHLVRSTYEQRVDNWLYEQGIDHEYEPRLPFEQRWYADFLANGWYIEIWGVKGSMDYSERKVRKIALYNAHHTPLIQVSIDSFSNRRKDSWQRRLTRCFS